jgi:Lrp/AsnC family leucine-responsive transcriptional regulator
LFLSGLDDIDRRLVELLIHNARMSYSDLGQAVGLSRVAVKARVRALEERGVIEEYTTIVNPQKISGAVSCYFELEVEPAQFSAVVDTLRASDTVTQIYQVSGRNKLHVHAVAAGQGELEDFLDRVIHRLPGVASLSCNIILSRIKDISITLPQFPSLDKLLRDLENQVCDAVVDRVNDHLPGNIDPWKDYNL